jgi:hypothetical protein
LGEGRGEASDKIVYKTVGGDIRRYNTYKISSDIYEIKKGEGGKTKGYYESSARREEC